MKKSIQSRVEESFNVSDKENITQYLDWLRSTLLDYSTNIRRMATILILLVAAFELVAISPSTQLNIGSFHVARNSIVFQFVPAVVAFLFAQIIVDTNKADQLFKVYSQVFSLWSQKAEENDLDALLLGPTPLYWRSLSGYRPSNLYLSDRVETYGGFVFIPIMVIGVAWFELQAYTTLLSVHSMHSQAIISLCVTGFFVVYAILAAILPNS